MFGALQSPRSNVADVSHCSLSATEAVAADYLHADDMYQNVREKASLCVERANLTCTADPSYDGCIEVSENPIIVNQQPPPKSQVRSPLFDKQPHQSRRVGIIRSAGRRLYPCPHPASERELGAKRIK